MLAHQQLVSSHQPGIRVGRESFPQVLVAQARLLVPMARHGFPLSRGLVTSLARVAKCCPIWVRFDKE